MKATAISILFATVLIGGAIMLSGGNGSNDTASQNADNVSVVDGKQIITINAKGSYSPRVTTAKAGVPTVIKVATNGTFDCTSALTIPSLGYRNNLPPSGETLIDIPPQKAGTTMRGLCAMGMYNFAVDFN
ncbi:MAG: hypothetical protein A3J10_02680 [Candidatus Sungbacteria bacterium RIFCSPLOWO2_02_FULL_54_10]|uniref:EfeO-type cupredoxin-like domain-containing protein n=1 Tax=Candidatus Sungbacteria bacterium RIFCSPHIGHO2_02_FULL_53_17 TaxID=1802275 RepID=A0A1G2KWU7_9BACT|nr:MAG: hypothetical protein A3C92_02920 [Candidatus Sungbacteria bacterium RIFCSPHIGHO2_02_FULL_53_17]OHA13867.1 MAG: hypothetical protein A3J10_02680 [Candidatus Sungbacteria bacterium RIFCSPLOWO2_02_FULL_54_10]